MEIHPGIWMADLGLVYKGLLIIGDLQLGYEEALESRGVFVPRFQLSDILARLDRILDRVQVKTLLINGDLKHEFGAITNQEWRDALRLFDHVLGKLGDGGEIVLVKGNHDVALDPLAKKRNIRVVDAYHIDDITIVHGHKIVLDLRGVIIIGHEHPAISFPEKRDEKFKCYLKGVWKGKTLIVQPSFSLLTAGSDVARENTLSPFLKGGVKNFDVFVVEDEVRHFGKVKDVMSM